MDTTSSDEPIPPLTAAQKALVEANLHLVDNLAAHLRMKCPPHAWGDFEQRGRLGLIKAAIAYHEDVGMPFAGFAHWRIKGALLDFVREEARRIKYVPSTSVWGDGTNERQLAAGGTGVETAVHKRLLSEKARAVAKDVLDTIERKVFSRAFRGLSQEEVARDLSVSPGWISKLIKRGTSKILAALNSEPSQ